MPGLLDFLNPAAAFMNNQQQPQAPAMPAMPGLHAVPPSQRPGLGLGGFPPPQQQPDLDLGMHAVPPSQRGPGGPGSNLLGLALGFGMMPPNGPVGSATAGGPEELHAPAPGGVGGVPAMGPGAWPQQEQPVAPGTLNQGGGARDIVLQAFPENTFLGRIMRQQFQLHDNRNASQGPMNVPSFQDMGLGSVTPPWMSAQPGMPGGPPGPLAPGAAPQPDSLPAQMMGGFSPQFSPGAMANPLPGGPQQIAPPNMPAMLPQLANQLQNSQDRLRNMQRPMGPPPGQNPLVDMLGQMSGRLQ